MDLNEEFRQAKIRIIKEYALAILSVPMSDIMKVTASELLQVCQYGAKYLIIEHGRANQILQETLGVLIAHNVFSFVGAEGRYTYYELNETQYWI